MYDVMAFEISGRLFNSARYSFVILKNLLRSPPVLSCIVNVIPLVAPKPLIIGGAKARI